MYGYWINVTYLSYIFWQSLKCQRSLSCFLSPIKAHFRNCNLCSLFLRVPLFFIPHLQGHIKLIFFIFWMSLLVAGTQVVCSLPYLGIIFQHHIMMKIWSFRIWKLFPIFLTSDLKESKDFIWIWSKSLLSPMNLCSLTCLCDMSSKLSQLPNMHSVCILNQARWQDSKIESQMILQTCRKMKH